MLHRFAVCFAILLAVLGTSSARALTVFSDDFSDEASFAANWTIGGTPSSSSWARTSEASNSPSFSVTDSPGANYANSSNTTLTSRSIDLTGLTGTQLSFAHRIATELDRDFGRVDASANGSAFTVVGSFSGSSGGAFLPALLDLSAFDGSATFYLRFRLQSNAAVVFDGWHIDDVVISGIPEPETFALMMAGLGLLAFMARRRSRSQELALNQRLGAGLASSYK